MVDPSRVAVILPALNEALTIGPIVREIRQRGMQTFVVDDGSTDATSAEARSSGAMVLKLPNAGGAWMAIQAGLRYAAAQPHFDRFITIDADGQHDPKHLSELLQSHESKKVNMVIGSCPERGSRARRFTWNLFAKLTGLTVGDLTSGFRVYDRKAVETLLSLEGVLLDYQDIGVLLLLRRSGITWHEHPICMSKRTHGHSRIFDSWFDVSLYMAKTLTWIFADWMSGRIKPYKKRNHDSL